MNIFFSFSFGLGINKSKKVMEDLEFELRAVREKRIQVSVERALLLLFVVYCGVCLFLFLYFLLFLWAKIGISHLYFSN